MIVPPIRIVRAGTIVEDVFRLLLAQIRSKHETAGDPARRSRRTRRASGACRRSSPARRDTVLATIDELVDYTERRTRAELEALPHGTYEAETVDTDGYTDEPVRLAASRSRATASVRPRGLRPAAARPVNSTYAQTFSACAYVVKCLIDPDLPVNDGFYRLITRRRARRHRRQLHLAGAGRRRLGDRRRASPTSCSARCSPPSRTASPRERRR